MEITKLLDNSKKIKTVLKHIENNIIN